MVVNHLQLPWTVHMVPREKDLRPGDSGEMFSPRYGVGGPQRGTPFAAVVTMFNSPFGLPCLKPPYGEIAVVDLTTQQIVWRRGMGPLELGFPYVAGSIVTAGGLIFIGGVMDGQLRAIDVLTGDVLWKGSLRSSSEGTPMSYVSPKSGRQYVVVTVPGTAGPQDEGTPETGGRVIAYALPDGSED